ncbi:MAG: Gfo/Idh/MocA family oxidoreductase, partial [Acidobacteriota bacterium]|nr:Gfo/Idh/MocA family oxidoreductase [Acidobacteriota bacterium]
MTKVKIGIIGTGYIGGVHSRIHAGIENSEVCALYDIVQERAERVSKAVGGKVCRSREELFESCDAVLVCTPNKTHVEIAADALRHGKHVFCEKPFAIGVEDARLLLGEAEKSG